MNQKKNPTLRRTIANHLHETFVLKKLNADHLSTKTCSAKNSLIIWSVLGKIFVALTITKVTTKTP
jgi:hypothetical protein